MAAYGGLGLQQSALSIIRADLPSVHDHLLRTVRAWDLPWGISFLLAVWGREAALPCSLEIK